MPPEVARLHGLRLESSQSTPANIGMAGSRPGAGLPDHVFPQHSSQQVLGSKVDRCDEEVCNEYVFSKNCLIQNLKSYI